jgi:plastocyanin
MEALRTEASFARQESLTSGYARTALPLLLPMAILAFALLFIYGLSRVYLEIRGDNAVALAAVLAIVVLLVAAYFAANPRVPGWQIGGVIALGALLLAGGAIWAVAEEDEGEATEGPAVEEPGAPGGEEPGGEEPGGPGGGQTIVMGDNFFEFGGAQEPTIQVTAGEATEFEIVNEGSAIHNMHVAGEGSYDTDFCDPADDDPCSDPNQIRRGQSGTIEINIAEPGTYDFRCDFHAAEMTGTVEVQ